MTTTQAELHNEWIEKRRAAEAAARRDGPLQHEGRERCHRRAPCCQDGKRRALVARGTRLRRVASLYAAGREGVSA